MKTKTMVMAGISVFLMTVAVQVTAGCGGNICAYAAEEDSCYDLVMLWPSNDGVPEGLSDVEAAVNEITEAEIGVTVHLEAVYSGLLELETNMRLAAGEKLDLCVSIQTGLSNLADADYLLELDDLLEESGQELKEVCGIQLAGGYYQGKLYGIPTVYAEGYRYGFICRTDLLEKYGIEIEEEKYYSFDELEEIFEIVKQGEGEDFYMICGSLTVAGDMMLHSCCLWDSLGASVSSGVLLLETDMDTDQIVNLYETEEYEAYAQRMYRWQQAGYFVPDSAMTEAEASDVVAAGNAFGWFFYNVPGDEKEYAARSGYDVTFIPTEEACRMTEIYQTVLWSIPANCENPEKVMEFLNLLYTDETLVNLLQRGIEGVSYVVEETDGVNKKIALPEGETVESVPYYMWYGIYGNRLQVYVWAPGDLLQNEIMQEFSDNIRLTSPALNYVFDSGEMTAEISAINEVRQKYLGVINTGLVDPEIELPLFLEELKAAGIDEVIAENQRQYDLWREQ